MQPSETTHFGYTQVPVAEKANKVAAVFHSVAHKYDVMNDLMSFGIHRLWKRFAMKLTGLTAGNSALDLAGGTGDLTALMVKQVGPTGKVVLSDINSSMLEEGRKRLVDRGLVGNIDFCLIDAEQIPFPDNTFHCVTIGFGLRNVTHKEKALAEMLRVLKPGGVALILEFSKPVIPALSKVYDLYSFSLLPKIGKWIARDEESYRYLAESIRMHPDQATLRQMMLDAGFMAVDVHNLTGGIVAIHRGFKF